MKPEEVKKYYKTGYKFNKITKMSANTLANWIKCGYVPYAAQKVIEQLTNGELVTDWHQRKLEAKDECF